MTTKILHFAASSCFLASLLAEDSRLPLSRSRRPPFLSLDSCLRPDWRSRLLWRSFLLRDETDLERSFPCFLSRCLREPSRSLEASCRLRSLSLSRSSRRRSSLCLSGLGRPSLLLLWWWWDPCVEERSLSSLWWDLAFDSCPFWSKS